MKPRISVITLGVDALERALAFYRDGLGWPTEGIVGAASEHGGVVFFDLQPALKLALFARGSLALDAGLADAAPGACHGVQGGGGNGGAPAFALSHNVAGRADVDAVLAQAASAGARITQPARDTFWGGYAGYFQDPDGHLWEVAWNPKWPVPED